MTYINRADLIAFITGSMPGENLEEFDIDAIADELIAEAGDYLHGEQPVLDMPGPNRVAQHIDWAVHGFVDDYWGLIARHRVEVADE